MQAFVYKLNFGDEAYYVGCSTNIERRFKEHYSLLKKNTHYNRLMQEAYNIYGKPLIEVLEICIDTSMYTKEIEWIERLGSFYKDNVFGLNLTIGGEGTGHGTKAANSKYSAEKIIEVFNLLLHTENTQYVISVKCKCSEGLVRGIASGLRHSEVSGYVGVLEYNQMLHKRAIIAQNNIYKAKLSDAALKDILLLLCENTPYKIISSKHGVSDSIISMIKSGKRYKHSCTLYPNIWNRLHNG